MAKVGRLLGREGVTAGTAGDFPATRMKPSAGGGAKIVSVVFGKKGIFGNSRFAKKIKLGGSRESWGEWALLENKITAHNVNKSDKINVRTGR